MNQFYCKTKANLLEHMDNDELCFVIMKQYYEAMKQWLPCKAGKIFSSLVGAELGPAQPSLL